MIHVVWMVHSVLPLSKHTELVCGIIFIISFLFDREGDRELFILGDHRSGQFLITDQQKTTDNEYITDPIRLIGTPLMTTVYGSIN